VRRRRGSGGRQAGRQAGRTRARRRSARARQARRRLRNTQRHLSRRKVAGAQQTDACHGPLHPAGDTLQFSEYVERNLRLYGIR
jgi:hypothetical protein